MTFVAAVGQNDIVHKTISDGSFALKDKVIPTWSCAIDIQVNGK